MKTISAGIFALILTATSSIAGGCAKLKNTNLEAMACNTGYTWDEKTSACVQDPSA